MEAACVLNATGFRDEISLGHGHSRDAVQGNLRAKPSANSRSPHGPLNVACQNCHTAMGWKPIRSKPEFDHNQTKFPLRGMHESVTCTQCHIKPVFSNTGTRCADCHADIHKRQLGANCEQCHTVKGWKVQSTRLAAPESLPSARGARGGRLLLVSQERGCKPVRPCRRIVTAAMLPIIATRPIPIMPCRPFLNVMRTVPWL